MRHTPFGLAFLAAVSASSPAPAAAPALPSGAVQDGFAVWFEVRGLAAEEERIVATGLEEVVRAAGRLSRAPRPEAADLIVRLTVGTPDVDLDDRVSTRGAPVAGASAAGSGRSGLESREAAESMIDVHLGLVDIFTGIVLSERSVHCGVPLIRGDGVLSACLRDGLSGLADEVAEWEEREAAALASGDDFGPPEAEQRRLDPAELATAFFREGVRASRAGFAERALDLMAEAQPRFKEAGMRREEGTAWWHLAFLMAATHRGPDRAIKYAEQAIRIARELSDRDTETRVLNLLAACEARVGRYRRAARIANAAAGRGREIGDPLTEATSTGILAGLAAIKGDLDGARELQGQALQLMQAAGNPAAEARLRLAMAIVTARDDDRLRSASLSLLDDVRVRAGELGDLALLRDATFVSADTRYGTTDFGLVVAGEVDAIRAHKLAVRLEDSVGEAAAIGLLGAFGARFGRTTRAHDYLAAAHDKARDAGFGEGVADSAQLLGEISPDTARGVSTLQSVVSSRDEAQDLRGQVKTLNDLSRLQSGLGREDDAWESYLRASAAVQQYASLLRDDPDQEDIREGFTTVLKSLITTRTDLPFMPRYLQLDHMVPLPNPSWVER